MRDDDLEIGHGASETASSEGWLAWAGRSLCVHAFGMSAQSRVEHHAVTPAVPEEDFDDDLDPAPPPARSPSARGLLLVLTTAVGLLRLSYSGGGGVAPLAKTTDSDDLRLREKPVGFDELVDPASKDFLSANWHRSFHADAPRRMQVSLDVLQPPNSAFFVTANINASIAFPLSVFTVTPAGMANVSITDQLGNPIPKTDTFINYVPRTVLTTISLGTSSYTIPGITPYTIYNNLIPGRNAGDVAFNDNGTNSALYFAKEEGVFVRSFSPGAVPNLFNSINLTTFTSNVGLPPVRPSGGVVKLVNGTMHLSGKLSSGGKTAYFMADLTNTTSLNIVGVVNVSQTILKMIILPNTTVLQVPTGVMFIDTSNISASQISATLAISNLYDLSASSNFLALSALRQMYFYNFTDPYAPVELLRPASDNNLFNAPVALYNSTRAVIGDGNNGFYLKDLTKTDQPQVLAQILPWDADPFDYNTRMLELNGQYLYFVGASKTYVYDRESLQFLAERILTVDFPRLGGEIYMQVGRYTVANNLIIQSVTTSKGVVHCIIDARSGSIANAAVLYTYIDKSKRGQAQSYRYTGSAVGYPPANTYFTVTAVVPNPRLMGASPAALTSNVFDTKKQYIDLAVVQSSVGDPLTATVFITPVSQLSLSPALPLVSLSHVQSSDYFWSNTGWVDGDNLNGISIIPASNENMVFLEPFINGTNTHIFSLVNREGMRLASFNLPYITNAVLNYMTVLPLPNSQQFIVSYGTNISSTSLSGNVSVLTIMNSGQIIETVIANNTFSLSGFAVCKVNSKVKLYWKYFPNSYTRADDITSYVNTSLSKCISSVSYNLVPFGVQYSVSVLNDVTNKVVFGSFNSFSIYREPEGFSSSHTSVGSYTSMQSQRACLALIDSKTLCMAQTNVGVLCFDVTSLPVLIGQLNIVGMDTVYSALISPSDSGILLIGTASGIYIVNVDNPQFPVLLFKYPTSGPVASMVISGSSIITSIQGQGIFNITAPSLLRNVDYYTVTAPPNSQGTYNLTARVAVVGFPNQYADIISELTIPNRSPAPNSSLVLANQTFLTNVFKSVVLADSSYAVIPDADDDTLADTMTTRCSNGLSYVAADAVELPIGQALPFLTYSPTSIAPGSSVPMLLSGSWPLQSVRACEVIITRSDGKGGTSKRSFFVYNPYQPPISITGGYPLFSTTAVTNATLSSNAGWTDPNGYPLQCVLVWADRGILVVVNPTTCIPTISTLPGGQGLNGYIIQATKMSASGALIIDPASSTNTTGLVDYRNTAPVLAATTAAAKVGVYTSFKATGLGVDADSDLLTYAAPTPPRGFVYNPVTGNLSGIADVGLLGVSLYPTAVSDPYITTEQNGNTLIVTDPSGLTMPAVVNFLQNQRGCLAFNIVVKGELNATLTLTVSGSATLSFNGTAVGGVVVFGSGSSIFTVSGMPDLMTFNLQQYLCPIADPWSSTFVIDGVLTNGWSAQSGRTTFVPSSDAVSNPLEIVSQSTTLLTTSALQTITGNLFQFLVHGGNAYQVSAVMYNVATGLVATGFTIQISPRVVSSLQNGNVIGGAYTVTPHPGTQGPVSSTDYAIIFTAYVPDPITGDPIPAKSLVSQATPLRVTNVGPVVSRSSLNNILGHPGHNLTSLLPAAVSTDGDNLTISVESAVGLQSFPWMRTLGDVTVAPELDLSIPLSADSAYPLQLRYSDGHPLYDVVLPFQLINTNALFVPATGMDIFDENGGMVRLSPFVMNYAGSKPLRVTAIVPQQFGLPEIEALILGIVPDVSFHADTGSYYWQVVANQSVIYGYRLPITIATDKVGDSSITVTYDNFGEDPVVSETRTVRLRVVYTAPVVANHVADITGVAGSSFPIPVPTTTFFSRNAAAGVTDVLTQFDGTMNRPVWITWDTVNHQYLVQVARPGVWSLAPCASNIVHYVMCDNTTLIIPIPPVPSAADLLAVQTADAGRYIGYASAGVSGFVILYKYLISLMIASCKRDAEMKKAAKKLLEMKKHQAGLKVKFSAVLDERSVNTDSLCKLIESIQADIRHERYVEKDTRLFVEKFIMLPKLVALRATIEGYVSDLEGSVSTMTDAADRTAAQTTNTENRSFFMAKLAEIEEGLRQASTPRSVLYDQLNSLYDQIFERFGNFYPTRDLAEKVGAMIEDVLMENLQRKIVRLFEDATFYSLSMGSETHSGFEAIVLSAIRDVCVLIEGKLSERKPGAKLKESDEKTTLLAQYLVSLLWCVFASGTINGHAVDVEVQLQIIHSVLGVKKAWYKKCCTSSCSKSEAGSALPGDLEMWLKTANATASWFLTMNDDFRHKLLRLRRGVKPGGSIIAPSPVKWFEVMVGLFFNVPFVKLETENLNELILKYMQISNSEPQVLRMYRAQLMEIGKVSPEIKARVTKAIEIRQQALLAMNDANEERLRVMITDYDKCSDAFWIRCYSTCLNKIASKGPSEVIRTLAKDALIKRRVAGEEMGTPKRSLKASLSGYGRLVGATTAAKRAKGVLAANEAIAAGGAGAEDEVVGHNPLYSKGGALSARTPVATAAGGAVVRTLTHTPARPIIAPWGSASTRSTSSSDDESSSARVRGKAADFAGTLGEEAGAYSPTLIPRGRGAALRTARTSTVPGGISLVISSPLPAAAAAIAAAESSALSNGRAAYTARAT